MLEQFNFPYKSIFDPEIKAGNLIDKYDVLIFPSDSTQTITGEAPAPAERALGAAEARGGRRRRGAEAVDAAATLRPNTAPASARKASTPSAILSRKAARW